MVNISKIMKFVNIVALGMPVVQAWKVSGGSVERFFNELKSWYFGIWPDGSIHLTSLFKGWGPFFVSLLIGAGVKLAPKMINSIIKFFK